MTDTVGLMLLRKVVSAELLVVRGDIISNEQLLIRALPIVKDLAENMIVDNAAVKKEASQFLETMMPNPAKESERFTRPVLETMKNLALETHRSSVMRDYFVSIPAANLKNDRRLMAYQDYLSDRLPPGELEKTNEGRTVLREIANRLNTSPNIAAQAGQFFRIGKTFGQFQARPLHRHIFESQTDFTNFLVNQMFESATQYDARSTDTQNNKVSTFIHTLFTFGDVERVRVWIPKLLENKMVEAHLWFIASKIEKRLRFWEGLLSTGQRPAQTVETFILPDRSHGEQALTELESMIDLREKLRVRGEKWADHFMIDRTIRQLLSALPDDLKMSERGQRLIRERGGLLNRASLAVRNGVSKVLGRPATGQSQSATCASLF